MIAYLNAKGIMEWIDNSQTEQPLVNYYKHPLASVSQLEKIMSKVTKTLSNYLDSIKKTISGMKDWKITEEVYMDIFSYQKYIMFKDLSEHGKLLQENDLVKAFVGDKNALQDEISESQRDEFEEDANEIDVLPADST